ncbi:SpoIIE family protein phosphatase [Streptomyces sp. SID8379]|uniref:PP2C family protein-serine/threonine phosphatase n=1 Tax=unclassified Streptomyces TaxID=2593676 RepID=UPI000374B485|nr:MULTISPECIES: PP2C family protein-serine/threonine phosphatase [unclassified Streptomyces]MYW70091.1 SpoIIE family protein phosphatase [Streptomyces sp. SID8379]
MLVADGAGRVVSHNDEAAVLMPGLIVGAALADVAPAWLADAHEERARDAGDHAASVAGGLMGEYCVEAFPGAGPAGCVTWWLVDDGDLRFVQAQLDSERAQIRALQEISSELLSSLNVERCMEVTASMAARHLADAVVVVGVGSGRSYPVTWACADGSMTQQRIRMNPEEVPGLEEALLGFPPVPSRWIDPALIPAWAIPEGFARDASQIGSVVVVPLPGHGLPAGAIVMMRRGREAAFTEAEEAFARLFAARAGAALSAARVYAEQTRITDVLMRELLPPRVEQAKGIDFSARYRASAATERIGGDFYDVYPADSPEGETFAVLGDVCGKGLEAAVLTGKIRNAVEALLPFTSDHARLLTLLNSALLSSHHTRFATMALASAKRVGGQVRLRVTSAGHPTPLLIRADGRVETAQTRGTLVGALPQVESTTAVIDLEPGETCLFYSDGITEAHGGPLGDRMFGEERLHGVLAECAGLPAEAVTERVQMVASQWVGDGHHDDMAVLAITAPRSAHLTAVDGHTRGRFTA